MDDLDETFVHPGEWCTPNKAPGIFALMFEAVMRHVEGVGRGPDGGQAGVDEKCCRPFAYQEPISVAQERGKRGKYKRPGELKARR